MVEYDENGLIFMEKRILCRNKRGAFMKAINILFIIYIIIVSIVYIIFALIEVENENTIGFSLFIGAILLALVRYCIKVKNERK